jgi:hypothetical protein
MLFPPVADCDKFHNFPKLEWFQQSRGSAGTAYQPNWKNPRLSVGW